MDTKPSFRTWLIGLIALGALVRVLPLVLPFDFAAPDSASYLEPARALLEYGSYADAGGQPTAARPPGYPLFLACVLGLSSHSLLAVQLAQALLGGLAAAGVFLILRRTTGRSAWARGGGLLTALDPIAIGQSPWILREAMLLALVVGLVTAWTYLRGRWRHGVCGLLLAALALTHQLYVLLGGFMFLAHLAAKGRPSRRGLIPWVGMGLIVILGVGLWASRTHRVTGHFSLASTENAVPARELWLTSACPNAWLSGDPRTGFQAAAWEEERQLVAALGVAGAKAEYYRRFRANWRDHPARTLTRTLRINAWYWLEIPGAIRLAYHPRLYWVRWLLLPFHWVRLVCAVAGIVFLVRTGVWRRHRVTLACLAMLALAPALLYPVPRYAGPVAPLLDLLAIIGFGAAWDARNTPRPA
jgi:4-amino-4-deoxy-L-arabinose transferase-like glycosyltransferase